MHAISMRLCSCRKCGIELEVNKTCNVCRKENQIFCHGCKDVSGEQIHADCLVVGLDSNLVRLIAAW